MLTLLVCLPGCRGCSKTPEQVEKDKQKLVEDEEKKKKEEEIPPFEADRAQALPPVGLFADKEATCKPGHWIAQTWQNLKSNKGDFQGELRTDVVDRGEDGAPSRVPLFGVPYKLTDVRPAALAKGQQKSLDSYLWAPPCRIASRAADDKPTRSADLKLATAGGIAQIGRQLPLKPMPSYRYFFVVLSKGSRFGYLNLRLDSIALHDLQATGPGPKYYEVVTMPSNHRPDLPANALYWTSIAYLLWDDSDPTLWDLDQQQAVVDWLHWGGQIIISGPEALEQLQGSFLRPYLPATVEKARTFAAADLKGLKYWAVDSGSLPKLARPWTGAVLKKAQDPNVAGLPDEKDDLVIERRVGRGRTVVTAFRIAAPEFAAWEGCDCFFNACLLRRGPREFSTNSLGEKAVRWAGAAEGTPPRPPKTARNNRELAKAIGFSVNGTPAYSPAPIFVSTNGTLKDAATNTAVRYFSRDAGVRFDEYATDDSGGHASGAASAGPLGNSAGMVQNNGALAAAANEDETDDSASGLGTWNDYSPVAVAARKALDNASGIKVPQRSFIVWVVVGYLCVLVPANWLVFRLIGRVEWAWITAPLIAIGCTAVVVRQAQLDIGFARSRNEVAVIEMQPGYSRAHVTRYTSLYTSLGTWYEFQANGPGAQILPFPRGADKAAAATYRPGHLESYGELVCRRGDDTRLSGFHVSSASADYVHSEEMVDFGGPITLREEGIDWRVTNGTKHPLENCQVMRCDSARGVWTASIDRLAPSETAVLKFGKLHRPKAPPDNPGLDQAPVEGQIPAAGHLGPNGPATAPPPTGILSDEDLRHFAAEGQEFRPGEVCLVASVADKELGLTVCARGESIPPGRAAGRAPHPRQFNETAARQDGPNGTFAGRAGQLRQPVTADE